MLKRVALAVGALGALGGWVGAGALTAAGAPKAYVGLFKDDAVAVIDTVQNKVLTCPSPKTSSRLSGRRPMLSRQAKERLRDCRPEGRPAVRVRRAATEGRRTFCWVGRRAA